MMGQQSETRQPVLQCIQAARSWRGRRLKPVFQPAGVSTHLDLLLLALRDCCCQHALSRLDNVHAVPSVGCPGDHIALPVFPKLKDADQALQQAVRMCAVWDSAKTVLGESPC